MNLFRIWGKRILLFHEAQTYLNHLLVPASMDDGKGFKAQVICPDGEVLCATQETVHYPSVDEAIAASKAFVDRLCRQESQAKKFLFDEALAYRNFLLCPVRRGQRGIGIVQIAPTGDIFSLASNKTTYPSVYAALTDAKSDTDLYCTFFVVQDLLDDWNETGLISATEFNALDRSVSRWHDATREADSNA